MSNRRKPNPAQAALEPYLGRVRMWNEALDRNGGSVRAIRRDMDAGELAHDHLDDEQLVAAIRQMRAVAARLPRHPGVAADRLMKAMRL